MKKLVFIILFALSIGIFGCDDDSPNNNSNNINNTNNTNNSNNTNTNNSNNTNTNNTNNTNNTIWNPRFDDLADALQSDLEDSTAYGVSVAVMENGQVTFAFAFGSKDAQGNMPLTPETLMQIGSTTKQMTSAALLRKVQNGTLSLDDTIGELLPNLEFTLDATWETQVTLHHLMSHQGAFVDWIPWAGSASDSELADYTYGTFDNNFYLMNPPGIFWNYSNPNFVFAGLIDQTYDTRMWPDIMVEDIFQPLGMNRTFLRKSEVEADGDYALSYGLGTDDLQTGNEGDVSMEMMPDPGWGRPAGLVWTTPTQMMAWAKFLMDGNSAVLSDEYREMITTPQVDTLYGAGSMSYGYGMFVETGYYSKAGDWYEMEVWEHGGNTMSFSNWLYILPEKNFAIAICASGSGVDFSNSIDTALMTLVDLPQVSEGPEYTFDATKLDMHVGTYHDPYNVGEVIITRSGNNLMVEAPDIAAAGYTVTPQLTAVSSDIFIIYVDGEGFDLTFIPEEEGSPSKFIRNRIFVATKDDEKKSHADDRISFRNIDNFIKRARLMKNPMFDNLLRRLF